jgi:mannitol/fructose-specific phosphotransferase system IIA component (Ntr-type)
VAEGCVLVRQRARTKDALFAEFAEKFSRLLPGLASSRIDQALRERERQQNTAVGDGIALPHAALPEVQGTHVGVFTTADAVDYQAPDGRPVDVFFVLVGGQAERATHLQALSTIAAMLLRTPLAERLRAAADREQVLEALEACAAVAE